MIKYFVMQAELLLIIYPCRNFVSVTPHHPEASLLTLLLYIEWFHIFWPKSKALLANFIFYWCHFGFSFTTWKVSVFGVFLVCIQSECGKIRTKLQIQTLSTLYFVHNETGNKLERLGTRKNLLQIPWMNFNHLERDETRCN